MAAPLAYLALMAACVGVQAGGAYSAEDAWALAHLEQSVYCSADEFNGWSVGPQVYNVDSTRTKFIYNKVSEATAGVGALQDPAGCFVAIRGTLGLVQDIADLDFGMKSFGRDSCAECKTHAGFLDEWESIKGDVFGALEAFNCTAQPLYLTGHSLGAAMLHMMIYDALEAGYSIAHATAMEAPRPGDRAFKAGLQKVIAAKAPDASIHRITHAHDVYPHLPPYGLFGYTHALPEIFYPVTATYSNYTDCGLDDSADFGGGKCANEIPVWACNPSYHCWFGGLNPCSCGK
eukprot:TRINITY_DN8128_c0_g1_i1.p1 TRINITY_DN8128_c0_g1~~TRINITY_DN8128_c0_g1_i1.p1  ORF type:complete len:290 (+),score=90.42 TRINITY_DN8128_c0_g1_i1:55-924(+)